LELSKKLRQLPNTAEMSAWDDDEPVASSSQWQSEKPSQVPSLSWAEDDEDEPQKIVFAPREEKYTDEGKTGYEDYDKDYFDDEEAIEAPLLSRETRQRYEADILSNPPFVQEPTEQICNLDLTALVRNNYPSPLLLEKISECFSDTVELDEEGNPMPAILKYKICEPLVDSKPGQMRYVVDINGAPFILRRENYSDWNDDVVHQYLIMALMRKIYNKIPMLPYPFGIFRASYNCQYTGEDNDKLFNFLLTSYTSFNNQDTVAGGDKSSNDPGRRQMSFHVAVAPPRTKTGYVKPLLNAHEAWNLVKLMIEFLEFADTYYYRFSHGDAHYHNWYLRDLGEVKRITIPWKEKPKHFYSRYLPVLSDFGRASFIFDGNRYGMESKYYAVPPPIDYIIEHDMIQLLYGLIKDFDYTRVNYNRGSKRGYLLDLYFNGALQYFYKKDPIKYSTFRKVDIVAGSDGRGTSFAEMARLFTGKPEVVQWIYDRIDKEFSRHISPVGTPLNPSTKKIVLLKKRCALLPKFPANYKLPTKKDFEDARHRSEVVNYLREESDDDPSESLNYLISYMDLSMKLNEYDTKEGLIVDRLLKILDIQGIRPEKFNREDREIYDRFMRFKNQKDAENRQQRLETSSAQLNLAGNVEYITPAPRSSPSYRPKADEEGFRPVFKKHR